MVAFLAGAGFSKWAAGPPLAKELFDSKIKPFGVGEATWLERALQLKSLWDQEHPTEPAEAFTAHALEREAETRRLVLWYVVRRLSDPYIWEERHAWKWRRHVLMLDENRRFERPGVARVQDFLIRVMGLRLVGIITTNYDLLIEYALETRRSNWGVPGERLDG